MPRSVIVSWLVSAGWGVLAGRLNIGLSDPVFWIILILILIATYITVRD